MMRVLLVIIVFIEVMMGTAFAMMRSPRKDLQSKTIGEIDKNRALYARFDAIRGLECYKVRGWPKVCVSPAELLKDETLKIPSKQANKLHATSLRKKLQSCTNC